MLEVWPTKKLYVLVTANSHVDSPSTYASKLYVLSLDRLSDIELWVQAEAVGRVMDIRFSTSNTAPPHQAALVLPLPPGSTGSLTFFGER